MQCSVFIAVSLDGLIAREDGAIDWLDRVNLPGEDYGYRKFADSVDAIAIGRGTYDTVLGFPEWHYTGKRVIVLTHRPPASRHGEEFFAGSPTELVERLDRDGVRRAYIDGGDVIRQFLRARLIDDLTLSIVPVVLGRGRPLFGAGGELPLVLDGVDHWPSGLVQLRYRA